MANAVRQGELYDLCLTFRSFHNRVLFNNPRNFQLEVVTFRADNMVEVCPGHIFQHTTIALRRKDNGESREAHFGDSIVFNAQGQALLWTRIGDPSFRDFVREATRS